MTCDAAARPYNKTCDFLDREAPLTDRLRSRSLRAVMIGVVLRQVPRLAAALRLFCALAVAVVTTFHTCGIATAETAAPTVVYAAAESDAPDQADLSAEKCHICTVVSLPALMTVASAVDGSPGSFAASVRDLVSFTPHITSPPPKA